MLGLSRAGIMGQSHHSGFVPQSNELKSINKQAMPLKTLYEEIYRGGMPAVFVDKKINLEVFFSSYVQTYLECDIKDLTQVGDELVFLCFLTAAERERLRKRITHH